MLDVKRGYARWAAVYDDNRNLTRDLDAVVLREAGLPVAGARVVEFGAGTGKNTAFLAAEAAEVVALDLSAEMLAVARGKLPASNVRFVEHDVRAPWPVEPGWADLVVGNLVLEHVADVRPVLAHAFAALRPGGLLHLCELHPYRQWCGSGAQFDDGAGVERVEAYVHGVADYVGAGLAAGFVLRDLGEHGDAGAVGQPPRLLRLLFARQ